MYLSKISYDRDSFYRVATARDMMICNRIIGRSRHINQADLFSGRERSAYLQNGLF